MILAGDVGGTKTLIGLFAPGARRPVPVDVREFITLDYDGLPAIVDAFLAAHGRSTPIASAAFGVAGPVIDQHAEMTNVPWHVDAAELARGLHVPAIRLLNDLESMAHGVPVLQPQELRTLQAGEPHEGGAIGIIAAGTGLGESVLHRCGGRYAPLASEGGHSDFAARSERELDFVRYLSARFGRAEIEHVLSGPGLVNLAGFTHADDLCAVLSRAQAEADIAAEISRAAMTRQCAHCVEALDLFVAAYGAAAGNLALTAVTTGGMFIGGGIAPRILPALEDGRFIAAFTDKGPMRPLLEAMPVQVILNPQAGLLGAAVFANTLA
jgi:glucokinase